MEKKFPSVQPENVQPWNLEKIGFLISKKNWGFKPEKIGFDTPFVGLISSNTEKSQVCSTWQIYGYYSVLQCRLIAGLMVRGGAIS